MTTATWGRVDDLSRASGILGPHSYRRSAEKNRALVDDVEWLASSGTAFIDIARRLGKNPGALERALYRAGRPDLAALNPGRRYRG